jgi:hypothetical protein
MESITRGGRSATIVLAWLIALIALACATWALTHLGSHPGAVGLPGLASGSVDPHGLPWG